MRALKTILIIVLALLAIVVVLGLIGPSSFRVERSTVIKAPAELVYGHISTLAAMDQWGPWKEQEHNMTAVLSGSPDGQVGAISHWKSDESEGEQELAELVPNRSVRTKLWFISPWEAHNEGTFDLEAMGDSTRLTWGIQGQNTFMGKVMGVFMDMDKMVGPMFEKGLANLKGIVEPEAVELAAATAGAGYEIVSIERPAMVYFGTRKVVKWSDFKSFYGENFGKAMGIIMKAGVQPASAPTGIFFKWDDANQQADVMAAVAVPAEAKDKLKGMSFQEVPASKAYQIAYFGPYEGSGKAHEAMDVRMKADSVELNGFVLEEYITDPMHEPDTMKWNTNVIYLIK